MKKRFILLVLALALCVSPILEAGARAPDAFAKLYFVGSTAVCEATISAPGKEIHATLELWHGDRRLAAWNDTGTSSLYLSGRYSAVKGQTYSLTVTGEIGGKPFKPITTAKSF